VTFAQTTSDEAVRELSNSKMVRGVLLPILA
jgi:hypothetical protein